MPYPIIEIHGLQEIIQRMREYPGKLNAALKITHQASLLTLWQNVPSYPPAPPDSTYDRTGTLGRTLGSSEGGGKGGGTPQIYETRSLGSGWESRFGTNLEYAPYVIGPDDQAWMHRDRWWTMDTIRERAEEKIYALFETMIAKLAAFLNGKSG